MKTFGAFSLAVILVAIAFSQGSTTFAIQSQRVNEPRGNKCADEGGVCNFRGAGTVYYGTGNLWIARPNSATGIPCTNQVFGDPAPDRVKSCYVDTNVVATASQGVRCAEENQTCAFNGRGTVYYGVGNTWIVQPHTNGVNCSNSVFGDPAANRMKACYVEPALTQPSGVRCANEGAVCRFQGSATVYYGAGRVWVTQRHTDSVQCTNAVFGDPTPNSAKTCFVSVDQQRGR